MVGVWKPWRGLGDGVGAIDEDQRENFEITEKRFERDGVTVLGFLSYCLEI